MKYLSIIPLFLFLVGCHNTPKNISQNPSMLRYHAFHGVCAKEFKGIPPDRFAENSKVRVNEWNMDSNATEIFVCQEIIPKK